MKEDNDSIIKELRASLATSNQSASELAALIERLIAMGDFFHSAIELKDPHSNYGFEEWLDQAREVLVDNFDERVKKIIAELEKMGMEHSPLIYMQYAKGMRPYYQAADVKKKEFYIQRLREMEKRVGTPKPFDWEDALK